MLNSLCRALVVAAIVICCANTTQAQIVQVEPGYVRAPFVRIYTGPGGTQVRAPFVDVQSRGRWGFGPSSRVELSALNWSSLRVLIQDLSIDLDDDLSDLAKGETWKVYLKTAEIRALVGDNPREGAPTPEVAGQLRQILKKFDNTRDNPTYRRIANLESFSNLAGALAEFVTPPELRARRQLAAISADLNRSLEQIGAGAGWQAHLALPTEFASADDAKPPHRDEIAKVLERFDGVAKNPGYRVIANLPEFQVAHEHLRSYAELVAGSATLNRPEPEELPAPPQE